MIKGSISCNCGSRLSFKSIMDTVACPNCGKEYKTKEHGTEDVSYEEELAHDYDIDHDDVAEDVN